MRAIAVFLALCVAGLVAYIVVAQGASKPTSVAVVAPTTNPVLRGQYLVTAMACGDCHSPHDQTGQPIKGLEYSGHPEHAPLPQWEPAMLQKNAVVTIAPTLTAFAGPFGVSVAPNLTPDTETGLVVSAEGLIESWRTGKHWSMNHRPVLPPMPVDAFKNLTDDDIRAVHAFLMALPPVKNRPPESVLAMPPGAPASASTEAATKPNS
jgi:hypothetical protein